MSSCQPMGRDEFPAKVKTAVALRASHRCSFPDCLQPTVGPSDEASDAVTMIGEAAHIHAASSGPGARRYLASMPPEQRSDIDNAIWLCANHARLIDRDEATYTPDALRAMKRAHEDRCVADLRQSATARTPVAELIAIGPSVICVGDMLGSTEDEWCLFLEHFVEGDIRCLMSYIEHFWRADDYDRYVCVGSLGDGRVLRAAPSWTRQGTGCLVRCPVFPAFPRTKASELGSDLALSDAHDLVLENGSIAMVSGVRSLPQKIKLNFSLQKGESAFYKKSGSRVAEYYLVLRNSAWFEQVLKLETIRLAAIPYPNAVLGRRTTPFQCVDCVFGVEVTGEASTEGWLPVKVDLGVKGLGRWQCEVSICVRAPERRPSVEEMLAS